MECIKYINDLNIEIEMLKQSLEECKDENEYNKINVIINDKNKKMNKYKENLNKLSDSKIEYRIYLKILNGLSITKAIEEVAEENYLNDTKPTTSYAIWKYYYPNLKKFLNV